MGKKQIESFKQLVLDGLKAQPKGAGLLLNVFYVDAVSMEIDDDDVREALAQLYKEGKVHPWSQPRKLWQTGLALGPKSPPRAKRKPEVSADSKSDGEAGSGPGAEGSPDADPEEAP